MAFLTQTKEMDNFLEALLRDPKRYLPIIEMLDTIIQNAAELSWLDCEKIGLMLGEQNNSGFCTGIRSGMISALDGNSTAKSSKNLEPILVYAKKLNFDSSSITSSDTQSVRNAGWSDQTIEDVIGLVAVLKVYSLLANGMGFKALPKAAFAEMGSATVQMKGYTPVFNSFLESMNNA